MSHNLRSEPKSGAGNLVGPPVVVRVIFYFKKNVIVDIEKLPQKVTKIWRNLGKKNYLYSLYFYFFLMGPKTRVNASRYVCAQVFRET
jgi:hypothetical protein